MKQEAAEQRPGLYAYTVAGILAFIYTLNYLDRQILSVLAEPIRHEIGLTDTQLGALGGIAFALFYTLCGIPVAWLADRVPRIWVIGAACSIWSVFTMACAGASNFIQFALLRIGVATGEAGGAPPSFSLISDYFPRQHRGKGLAIFSLGAPLGAMVGTALGGAVAATYGWRAAFIAAGAPGLVAALALVLLVKEPKRGGLDAAPVRAAGEEASAPTLGQAIRGFWANPVLRWVTLATALSAFVAYGATAWTTPLFIRTKGMTLMEVAVYFSGATVFGLAGTFASGWLVDRLSSRDQRWYSWMPAIAYTALIPLWLVTLWLPDWRWALVSNLGVGIMMCFYLTPAFTIIQNESHPQQRTVAGAILLFVVNLFGLGGGPLFVGMVSDYLKPAYGDLSLAVALAFLVPVMMAAVAAHLRASRMYGRGEDEGPVAAAVPVHAA